MRITNPFNLVGTIEIAGGFTYTSGTVNAGTSTVRFVYGNVTISSGTMEFNNVTFAISTWTGGVTVVGTMKINGTTTLANGGGNASIYGGVVDMKGDWIITTGVVQPSTSLFKISGSGIQTITSTSGGFTNGLSIESTGTVNLVGTIDVLSSFSYTSGTVNAGTSTVRFPYGNVVISTGSMVFNNVTFVPSSWSGSFTITGSMNINGTATLDNNNTNTALYGGSLNLGGNLIVSAGSAAGGTTQVNFVGTGAQTLTQASGTVIPGTTMTVNKSSGTLTLGAATTLYSPHTVSVTAGSIDMAGYSFTVGGTMSLATCTSVTKNAGTLTVNGSTVGTGAYSSGTVNP